MSRKRGKKQKPAGEAIPQDILAEGSGPVASVATVEDVATTDDIATTDDVVTPDDVVAEPAPPAPRPRGKRRSKRGAAADEQPPVVVADDASEDGADIEIAARNASELNNAELAALIGDAVAEDAPATAAIETLEAEAADLPEGEGDAEVEAETETDADADAELGEGDEDGQVIFPTSAASMDSVQLKHLVEALIFASDKPLTVQRLRQLTRCGDTRRLELALTELAEDYRERGVVLQQVSGGYQFRTRTQFSAWVQQFIAGRPVRLSRAQLETLAIIAYRQPITRPEIDDIRGVDSTATLKLLLDRALIRALGKREEVGRPTLYGTTKEFLDFFSLGDLRELPTLREYSELTAESRKVMSDRLGIPVDGDDSGSSDPDDSGSSGSGGDGGDFGGGGGDFGGGGGDFGGGGMPGSDDGSAPDDVSHASASADADAMASFFAAADAVDRSEVGADADDRSDVEPPADEILLTDDSAADDESEVTEAGLAFLVADSAESASSDSSSDPLDVAAEVEASSDPIETTESPIEATAAVNDVTADQIEVAVAIAESIEVTAVTAEAAAEPVEVTAVTIEASAVTEAAAEAAETTAAVADPVVAIEPDVDVTQSFATVEAFRDSLTDEPSESAAAAESLESAESIETFAAEFTPAPDGQVSADGWPAGSQPVAVVAPINIHPVEPPAMTPHAIDHPIEASSLDPAAGDPSAPHGDPVAE